MENANREDNLAEVLKEDVWRKRTERYRKAAIKAAETRARNRAAQPKMVYKSTLRTEFGLTAKEIMTLGMPDKTVRNPHYKNAPEANLYYLDRVLKFCTSIGK